MVVLPSYTTGFFSPFARLAVTARAWSSLHSSFIVGLECGCFFLFCAETFAVCVHLRKEPSPSPLVQYSHAKFVQYLLPSTRDACCKPHVFGNERNGFTTRSWTSQAEQGFREEEKGLREEEDVRAQRQKAASCHPLCPGASGSFLRALLRGPCAPAAVQLLQTIHKPLHPAASSTVSGPGELSAVVHSALSLPILVVALWWRTGTGKRTLL